jgi:hypothetical protein
MRPLTIALLALLLGACASVPKPATVKGGECKAFKAPKYIVKGETPTDDLWIDKTIEGGVAVCRWRRPQERPPAGVVAPHEDAAAKPKKKRRWWPFGGRS